MKPIIEVQNLSKVYNISHQQKAQYTKLTDTIVNAVKKPLQLVTGQRLEQEKFWALKDISFQAKMGDVVGIIGRNGSGKSTLLKILSRIVEPTSGQASMRGKVASLLEVGTGFHPELTGRENIFFNGAILGMSKREITHKFAEIVEFSEIEKFLDTPVKFYSSGMYVRLAFAVAAHLEPDILIVDEVLAVGDAQFQKKCLGKMRSVAKEGRTVLFVSHNMQAIEQLCNSVIQLDEGKVKNNGQDVKTAIKNYLFGNDNHEVTSLWSNDGSISNEYIYPSSLAIVDTTGAPITQTISNNDTSWVRIEGEIKKNDPALSIGYALFGEDGTPFFWSFHTDAPQGQWPKLKTGKFVLQSQIPKHLLDGGVYRVELAASLFARGWFFEPGASPIAVYFSVSDNVSDSPYWISKRPALLAPINKWELV